MNDTELLDYLQLSFTPQIGPATVIKLMSEFGEAGKVLSATAKQLQSVFRIGQKTTHLIRQSHGKREQLANELNYCKKHGIHIICYHSEDYPKLLKEIPAPPPVLFCMGNLEALTCLPATTLAVVGTRHPTLYGQRVTRGLTAKLSSYGFTIVSGLARGIDRVAHEATLDDYGTTLAVLGSGLRHIYPSGHTSLAKRIQQDGLVISEVMPSAPPQSQLFPRRNRIISGLSCGTLVAEAALRSGALITARHATEQNREVLAIPGMIDTAVASGCNKLIKDGAQLVESIDDILEALPSHLNSRASLTTVSQPSFPESAPQIYPEELSTYELQILNTIPDTLTFIDMLEIPQNFTTEALLSTLTTLELKQFISRPAGNAVVRIRPDREA
ncbi:MAG: DNA-protecting protein DprA [Planctomycetaceae bacterium]|nr:DNA-protecting protein DprA [Planctomycetaceae bacterium]